MTLASATIAKDSKIQSTLAEQMPKLMDQYGLVGLSVSVWQNDQALAQLALGKRNVRKATPVSVNDQWHLNSIGKSINASMIGRLVEDGLLTWQTRVPEIYPDSHKSWSEVTLAHLLTHTSGAQGDFPLASRLVGDPPEGPERIAQRQSHVLKALSNPTEHKAGDVHNYSNLGYTIAGAMAEKVSGRGWEQLIREEVFGPLGMTQSGFGNPAFGDDLSQPQGHSRSFGMAFPKAMHEDNPLFGGPSGSIHSSHQDLAKFAYQHLKGFLQQASTDNPWLGQETFNTLHSPALDDYAFGWVVENWDGVGPVLWHNGANHMWYSLLVILPKWDAIFILTSNDDQTQKKSEFTWSLVDQVINDLEN